MSGVRRNPITGEPVLMAFSRAARPFASTSAECPFCPGHEHETPPTIAQVGDPWRARAFNNKYPPIEGAEVIVESARHGDAFHDLDAAEASAIVALYRDRHHAHGEAKSVVLFKNEGARAGASIAHVHSQLIPLPFVPPRMASEAAGFARADSCPLCASAGVTISEGEHFVWIAPHASRMAYEQWLVPRRHFADVRELRDDEAAELAEWLRVASRSMKAVADAYNWSFHDFRGQSKAHFYVDLFPRTTGIAGFELGSGMFVEIVDPADAARTLSR